VPLVPQSLDAQATRTHGRAPNRVLATAVGDGAETSILDLDRRPGDGRAFVIRDSTLDCARLSFRSVRDDQNNEDDEAGAERGAVHGILLGPGWRVDLSTTTLGNPRPTRKVVSDRRGRGTETSVPPVAGGAPDYIRSMFARTFS
jgi:hypothetical protein